MKKTMSGSGNWQGSISIDYVSGQTYNMSMDWQQIIAKVFIDNNGADLIQEKISTKVDAPEEIKRGTPLIKKG